MLKKSQKINHKIHYQIKLWHNKFNIHLDHKNFAQLLILRIISQQIAKIIQ